MQIQIDIENSVGFSNQYRKHELIEAVRALKAVLATTEFKEEVMAFKFSDGARSFDSTKVLDDVLNFNRTIIVSRYVSWKWWSRVVGYVRGKSSNVIYANAKFWDVASSVRNASFLLHETSHLAGYSHSSASSRFSVPYGLNKCFEKAASRIRYV